MVSCEEIYDYLKKNKNREYSTRQLSEILKVSQQNLSLKFQKMRKDRISYKRLAFRHRVETYGGQRVYLVLVHKFE